MKKSHWSGFIPLNSTSTNAGRMAVTKSLEDNHNSNVRLNSSLSLDEKNELFLKDDKLTWRKLVGDVLIELMNSVPPEQMADLLAKNGLIKEKVYVASMENIGMSTSDAINKFKLITGKG